LGKAKRPSVGLGRKVESTCLARRGRGYRFGKERKRDPKRGSGPEEKWNPAAGSSCCGDDKKGEGKKHRGVFRVKGKKVIVKL